VTDGRRVLITGVAGQLAGRVARALEERDDVLEIIGVDVRDPQSDLRRTEFVRADVRNPLVARVLEASAIDTVIHLSTSSAPTAAGGRTRMKEANVIGAMQLMAACQQAPTVRRFVLKSSTAVYGSEHTDPVSFGEDVTPRSPPKQGFGKDAAEVEAYVRAFGRRRKDVDVTILRFANLLGPRVDSAFQSLFSLPVVPSVLGYDPRLQFCHEEDAVAVLERAATGEHPGVFNVAGDGVLYLSQCVRLAGRVPAPVPLPFVAGVASALRRARRADITGEQLRFLQFGRVVDTTRLREVMGYTPRYTTRETFDDHVHRRRIRGIVQPDDVIRWERELYAFLQRKGQERFLARQHEDGA
jgi:UDP-glucose 4-epimerase